MSKLVVDNSCVVIKWLTEEPGSQAARQLLGPYETGHLELLAPDFIYAELGNILWKKVRRNLNTKEEAERAINILRQLRFRLLASADLIEETLRIAFDHGQSPYDCLYVALSHRFGCPLVTADEALVRRVGRAFPRVVLLAGHP